MTTQAAPARQSLDQHRPSRPPVRRRWLAAAVVVPLLAGCASTSFDAQTNQIYQPGPGISDRRSDVYVLNALVVTDGSGNGTLVAGLINQAKSTDALTGVALAGPDAKAVDASIQSGTIRLRRQVAVQLADSGAVRFSGKLQAGANYSLTLTFADAAPVTVTVPVVTDAAPFASVPVGPITPQAT